jgi:hypothetical protein
MACTLMPSHFVWEMGRQAMWGGPSEGEDTTLGVHRSKPLMAAGVPEGTTTD